MSINGWGMRLETEHGRDYTAVSDPRRWAAPMYWRESKITKNQTCHQTENHGLLRKA
ncbi:hypothetical protein PILCRDRAFT_818415 [Piloderma croceum F 1598]|uniref:Uncharacterized protein n=1 Tax=Piloderma croceum (strain F 1598) TaxID=765440 RepID=A0A0C3C3G0_PILCF|nr:hypothetical protein PILCRDRAFT_818415 [Piloderma croceum F 1598]